MRCGEILGFRRCGSIAVTLAIVRKSTGLYGIAALAACAVLCFVLGFATREEHEFRIEFWDGYVYFVHEHNVYQEAFVPPLLEAEWWRAQDGTTRFFIHIGERLAGRSMHEDVASAP